MTSLEFDLEKCGGQASLTRLCCHTGFLIELLDLVVLVLDVVDVNCGVVVTKGDWAGCFWAVKDYASCVAFSALDWCIYPVSKS